MELDGALEIMPELVDMDVRLLMRMRDDSEESEDDSDESDESDEDSGNDADNEEAWVARVLSLIVGPVLPSGCENILRTCTQHRYEESATSLSLILRPKCPMFSRSSSREPGPPFGKFFVSHPIV